VARSVTDGLNEGPEIPGSHGGCPNSRLRRSREGGANQASVDTLADARRQLERESRGLEQLDHGFESRTHAAALNPRDRGLRNASPGGQSSLRQSSAPPRMPDDVTCIHRDMITETLYETMVQIIGCICAYGTMASMLHMLSFRR
jgi:hypothetical protein